MPTASNSLRTSRLRPSVMTTRYQRLAPSPPPSSIDLNWAGWPSIITPAISFSRDSTSSVPSTRTAYSRSTPKRGCISLLARSPELVNSSRPSVLMSRRPTDCHLPCCRRGRRRNTVGRCCGSSIVTTSPAGLWYAITRAGGGAMRSLTTRPATRTSSPNEIRWPVCATSPLTVTLPSVISCSMSRREPMPDCASTLCSLGASGSAASTRLAGIALTPSTISASMSKSPDSTPAKVSDTSALANSTTGRGPRSGRGGRSPRGGRGARRRRRAPRRPPRPARVGVIAFGAHGAIGGRIVGTATAAAPAAAAARTAAFAVSAAVAGLRRRFALRGGAFGARRPSLAASPRRRGLGGRRARLPRPPRDGVRRARAVRAARGTSGAASTTGAGAAATASASAPPPRRPRPPCGCACAAPRGRRGFGVGRRRRSAASAAASAFTAVLRGARGFFDGGRRALVGRGRLPTRSGASHPGYQDSLQRTLFQVIFGGFGRTGRCRRMIIGRRRGRR